MWNVLWLQYLHNGNYVADVGMSNYECDFDINSSDNVQLTRHIHFRLMNIAGF